jgi:flavin-dependent dehydrogenase
MNQAPVGIVGGGLAGLSAAITLARRGREVIAWESGNIGRDKVCGEFLSPEAAEDLEKLNCGDFIDVLHPASLRNIQLIGPGGGRIDITLPHRGGFGISRRALEAYLANRAREAGATILQRTSVRTTASSAPGLLDVYAGNRVHRVSSLILGFGKRSTLDSAFQLPRSVQTNQIGFVAFKAYYAPTQLAADVELYILPGGYVGVNPIEDGRIGVCGLFAGDNRVDYAELLRRAEAHPLLRQRLERLGEPISKPRGLARFSFGPQAISRHCPQSAIPLLFTGDAARLVPSFTGDGMAIALRSGRLAGEALFEADPVRAYQRSFSRTFTTRFALSNVLHAVFFMPGLFDMLAPVIGRHPKVVEALVRMTRG